MSLLKIPKASQSLAISLAGRNVAGMLALISAGFSWLACRFHSRAELELELVALRHQVAILNRQRPRRLRFCSIDRLLWVWLYRVWPRCLEVMVVAKPATVVQWHLSLLKIQKAAKSLAI